MDRLSIIDKTDLAVFVHIERSFLMAQKKTTSHRKQLSNSKPHDSGSKFIFGNAELCSQFLRNYMDIPLFKNIRAEDIEDVTERYVPMLSVCSFSATWSTYGRTLSGRWNGKRRASAGRRISGIRPSYPSYTMRVREHGRLRAISKTGFSLTKPSSRLPRNFSISWCS